MCLDMRAGIFFGFIILVAGFKSIWWPRFRLPAADHALPYGIAIGRSGDEWCVPPMAICSLNHSVLESFINLVSGAKFMNPFIVGLIECFPVTGDQSTYDTANHGLEGIYVCLETGQQSPPRITKIVQFFTAPSQENALRRHV